MAKIINCECGVILRGQTDEELVDNAVAHVKRDHPDLVGTRSRSRARLRQPQAQCVSSPSSSFRAQRTTTGYQRRCAPSSTSKPARSASNSGPVR
jgi:hypothetical protein